ncbi:MAG: PAS domain S-box protein, partial [Candidatus Hodarchaeota archaeon]
KKKDDTPLWCSITASTVQGDKKDEIYFDCVVEDITELKRVEEARKQTQIALQESEERYRELVEKMQEGVWAGNKEGYTDFVNPQTAEMLSYTQEEMLNKHWSALVPPEEQSKIEEIDRIREEEGISSTYETLLLAKDGRKIPVMIHGTPLFAVNGSFRGTMAVFTDISELKQAEEQLKRQKEELSQFANTMNHDLQNQFHNIIGYTTLLQKNLNPEYIEKIDQLVRNASELLHRSVKLADAGLVVEKIHELDITELIQEAARNTIPDQIVFSYEKLPRVACDRTKVVQIFQNLFENAVIHGKPQKIEIRRKEAEDGTSIFISNDGTPIPQEHRSKVFQQSFSTKKDKGGLGLATVRKLVEAHGWKISLEFIPETTFLIFIPNTDRAISL